MVVFLNGRFVPKEKAVVSIFDRAFLYGDGLFETLRVVNGVPFRWQQHLERLQCGAQALKIALPFDSAALRDFADRLLKQNEMLQALLRVTLSRGVGVRGYSPKGANRPFLAMSLHPAPPLRQGRPPQWRLATSSLRLLANDPLAQFKTCNKLPHIVARAEAEHAGANEALLLNSEGFVAEAAAANVFWLERKTLCTPPLRCGILAGVTRAAILGLSHTLGLANRETNLTLDQIFKKDGVFLSLSSRGVVEATTLDGRSLNQSALTQQIQLAYLDLLLTETGGKSTDTAP